MDRRRYQDRSFGRLYVCFPKYKDYLVENSPLPRAPLSRVYEQHKPALRDMHQYNKIVLLWRGLGGSAGNVC